MGYCQVEDVQAIVDTDMEIAEIQDLIDETDAIMDLSISSSASAMVLRAISRTGTAYKVMLKDPASQTVGGVYTDNRTENLRLLRADYMDMMDKASSGIAFLVGKAEYVR